MLHDGFSEMHRVEEGRADDCIGPASARLRAVPPGDTSNKGGQGADMLCGACVACGSEPRLPGGNQFPPDAPLRSPRGIFARFSSSFPLRVIFRR